MGYLRKRKDHCKVEDIVCAVSNNGISDNHSVAYCLLGYLCGYYRYYHPLEFITSFLNNAANDEDIRNGTAYANKVGIKVTMPKWGVSKGEYYFDREKNIIAKGVTSIKYMSEQLADEMYILSQNHYDYFIDLIADLKRGTSINSRQLEILIKLDFFSDFGNQRELLRITDVYSGLLKDGEVKHIKKEAVDGTPFGEIIARYSNGKTKAGAEAKSYTVLDAKSIMHEIEDAIKAAGMEDLSDIVKIQNFHEAMGYIGYTSGKEEDRRKLYILDTYPLIRKKDGKQFGYSVITKSIGSGVESRFTVFNRVYDKEPIHKGDVIYCKGFERNGQYFTLTMYERVF